MIKIRAKANFQHQSRAIIMCLFDKTYPSAILNHSTSISVKKGSKIESENQAVTDGWTDTQLEFLNGVVLDCIDS